MSSPALKYFSNLTQRPIVQGYKDANNIRISMSTRNYSIRFRDLDNVIRVYNCPKNYDWTVDSGATVYQTSFAAPRTGNVKLYPIGGKGDVYSISLRGVNQASANVLENKVYIEDLGVFLRQFNRLFSFHVELYAYGAGSQQATVKGDLSQLPLYLEKVALGNIDVVNAPTNFYLNLNNYSNQSKLKSFVKSSATNVSNDYFNVFGDIGKLPPTIVNFHIGRIFSSAHIYYTSKDWSPTFERLSIAAGGYWRAVSGDKLLKDLDEDVVIWSAEKTITLPSRTPASDANLASLVAKGVSVSASSSGQVAPLADSGYVDIVNYCSSHGYSMPSDSGALERFINKLKGISGGDFWLTRDKISVNALYGNSLTHNNLRRVNLRFPSGVEKTFYGGLSLNSFGGLTGNGIDAYTSYNTPVSSLENFKQNDAGVIVVKSTDAANLLLAQNASATTTLITGTSASNNRINATTTTALDYSGTGTIGVSRYSSTGFTVYRKAVANVITATSVAVYNSPFTEFKGFISSTYSAGDSLLTIIGSSFTASELLEVRTYFNQYLSEIGLTPIA